MSLTDDEVRKIAHLARLKITPEEVSGYASNLSSILELVEQMNAVDTGDVEPMAHPQDVAQRLRQDIVTEKDQQSRFAEIAPQTEAGLYLVPKVIE